MNQTEFLNQHLSSFFQSLNALGDFLFKFSQGSAFSVWVKDTDNFKHIMSNEVCRTKWGLTDTGLEGLTTREVLSRVDNFSNLESELERIESHEQLAIRNNAQTHFPQVLLTHAGFVSVQHSILIPVYGKGNKTTALVGIAYDATGHTDLLHLFESYQNFYSSKKLAVSRFSQYFKLTQYFLVPLSCAELKTLLAMAQSTRAKQISQLLNISTKTVDNYVAALKDKLKANLTLELIIHALKSSNQWIPDPVTC